MFNFWPAHCPVLPKIAGFLPEEMPPGDFLLAFVDVPQCRQRRFTMTDVCNILQSNHNIEDGFGIDAWNGGATDVANLFDVWSKCRVQVTAFSIEVRLPQWIIWHELHFPFRNTQFKHTGKSL